MNGYDPVQGEPIVTLDDDLPDGFDPDDLDDTIFPDGKDPAGGE